MAWPFSSWRPHPVRLTNPYSNVRVELLMPERSTRSVAADSGAEEAPAGTPILAGESVREPMTPIAAACPP
ncbi:hypothetical protein Smic_45930 [Streptomyces microflavus]|uniref:Uncharacterized protein n=1 Tax=Streptomyces microflavus TaxID=1919 RepID=A0A7J0CWB1_STRMI|nr:hypothetical protein Smic_45930 [Streptomyces microflavus]